MSNVIRYFLAVFLIGAGVMLVLANIGIIDFGFGILWHYIYPVFILVIGLKWLIEFLMKRGTHWFLGLFFTVFGGLLLLDRFEIIVFYFMDIFKLWPLLISYLGFVILGFGFNSHVTIYNDAKDRKSFSSNKEKVKMKSTNFVVGSQDFSEANWRVEPMNINTLAGDFYLDFSKAFIPEKETPIYIRSLAGDVQILMPENIEFRLDATVKVGDIEVFDNEMEGINRTYYYVTENYEEAERKIDFKINLKAGSIQVDRV